MQIALNLWECRVDHNCSACFPSVWNYLWSPLVPPFPHDGISACAISSTHLVGARRWTHHLPWSSGTLLRHSVPKHEDCTDFETFVCLLVNSPILRSHRPDNTWVRDIVPERVPCTVAHLSNMSTYQRCEGDIYRKPQENHAHVICCIACFTIVLESNLSSVDLHDKARSQ